MELSNTEAVNNGIMEQAVTAPVENVSKVDKTEVPEAKQSMILESLNAGQAVQLWDFLKAGFEIADMDASHQREETKKGVSELEKSLLRCKTFYREIELYPAKAYINEGNGTPYRFDGTPIDISDPDIERLFVMPDGKQRSCAFANVMTPIVKSPFSIILVESRA